jgi:arsenite methyltransferase
MTVREEFDAWAMDGRDRGMEDRHWHTAKHALAQMPIESGERVLDLGTGSGYAARVLREATGALTYGFDGSPEMSRNAKSYTDTAEIEFLVGDFGSLPFAENSLNHAFSMEAFYYATDPHETLGELRRILDSGGTFHCAVNYYEENTHSHDWQQNISVEMTRWDMDEYRDAFREAGFHVAAQGTIPDHEVEIPPVEAFPTEGFDTREAMVERYRTFGTLLTVGVVP